MTILLVLGLLMLGACAVLALGARAWTSGDGRRRLRRAGNIAAGALVLVILAIAAVPAIGHLTGSGTISARGDVNFAMLAKLADSNVVSEVARVVPLGQPVGFDHLGSLLGPCPDQAAGARPGCRWGRRPVRGGVFLTPAEGGPHGRRPRRRLP